MLMGSQVPGWCFQTLWNDELRLPPIAFPSGPTHFHVLRTMSILLQKLWKRAFYITRGHPSCLTGTSPWSSSPLSHPLTPPLSPSNHLLAPYFMSFTGRFQMTMKPYGVCLSAWFGSLSISSSVQSCCKWQNSIFYFCIILFYVCFFKTEEFPIPFIHFKIHLSIDGHLADLLSFCCKQCDNEQGAGLPSLQHMDFLSTNQWNCYFPPSLS